MEKISLIVSAYNEEAGLSEFKKVTDGFIKDVAAPGGKPKYDYAYVFVNDGSKDRTGEILKELKKEDPEHVEVVTFARNFGHEAAMCAGLDYADGDYLVFMDADLQHPPRTLSSIMASFEDGAEIVSMARTKNKTAGAVKNLTSSLYYFLMNQISSMHFEPGASDFFALKKNAAEVLRSSYRDKVRFLRGYVQNIGFDRRVLNYEADERVAGESHYSLWKLFRLFMNTLISFSDLPLKAGIYAGILSGIAAVVLLILSICGKGELFVILTVLCFFFAVLFLLLGFLGEYVSLLIAETRDRPIYIVKNREK